MWIWRKSWSVALVLMVLIAPLAPVAACTPESTGSETSMHCPPDCPMMAMMQSQKHSTEVSANEPSTCCTIGSSRPAPVTESNIAPQAVAVAPAVEVVAFSQLVIPQVVEEVDTSPPPIAESQALLCTFLI